MTDLLYQTDSYCATFDARVTGVSEEHHGVMLDRTAFYPGGGGQPSDMGWLTVDDVKYAVTKVAKFQGGVLHFLEGTDPLPRLAAQAAGEIDWDRRYRLMRT